MVIKRIVTIVVFAVSTLIGNTQGNTEDLISTYNKLTNELEIDANRQVHAIYKSHELTSDGVRKTTNFELFADNNRNYLFSDEYFVCSDSILTVSVNDIDKIVYVGQSLTKNDKRLGVTRIIQAQPENLRRMVQVKSELFVRNGVQFSRLELEAPDELASIYKVDKVVYEFNENEIAKVEIYHADGQPIKKSTIELVEIDTTNKHEILESNPQDFILNSNGEILYKYHDFSVEEIGTNQVLSLK